MTSLRGGEVIYTRNFGDSDVGIRIPEGYDGTSLLDGASEPTVKEIEIPHKEVKVSPRDDPPKISEEASTAPKSSPKERLGILKIFDGILPCNIRIPHSIGDFSTEDLLLIGIALFLLLSKDGDKICALILAAMIFID